MQPLPVVFAVLSGLCLLSSVLCTECNRTQYKWPVKQPHLCCNKCLPGQHMTWRSPTACMIDCVPCPEKLFSDSYNAELQCEICRSCTKQHMVEASACNATHDAVCTCQAGFTCADRACSECVPTRATTRPAPTPGASTTETTGRRSKSVPDTVWFLVITALLCAGIALVLVTKISPFLQWFRLRHGYFLAEKPAVLQCAADEEVSKPVQEVCGKCDQPIDV
ncbi:CD27 antigen [Betta splendens]|uniref:CD27 antigen n=1 Tax=Betta splendens TaxID=158456 RepID=A0A6P7KQU5_BETSP|nr:CD27 antigen [Betta splendens]XP_055359100.1 CD27 antigen [Betta splendens]